MMRRPRTTPPLPCLLLFRSSLDLNLNPPKRLRRCWLLIMSSCLLLTDEANGSGKTATTTGAKRFERQGKGNASGSFSALRMTAKNSHQQICGFRRRYTRRGSSLLDGGGYFHFVLFEAGLVGLDYG